MSDTDRTTVTVRDRDGRPAPHAEVRVEQVRHAVAGLGFTVGVARRFRCQAGIARYVLGGGGHFGDGGGDQFDLAELFLYPIVGTHGDVCGVFCGIGYLLPRADHFTDHALQFVEEGIETAGDVAELVGQRCRDDLRRILVGTLRERRHADDELVRRSVAVDLPRSGSLDRTNRLDIRRRIKLHLHDRAAGEVHSIVEPGAEIRIHGVANHRPEGDEQGDGQDAEAGSAPGQERIVGVLEDAHDAIRC